MSEEKHRETLEQTKITPSIKVDDKFIERLDRRQPLVYKAYEELEKFYLNDIRRTCISEIIDGESIHVDPDNIMISSDVEGIDAERVQNQFKHFCTKIPYKYQLETVLKILEMEKKQEHLDPLTNKTIVSNGYQISLPIGAGKSLVFEFLSLFYREVPEHPIIVSTTGYAIPEHEQTQFKVYPYYYENCAYVKEDATAVMAITCKDVEQRKTTIILTHNHLIPQMKRYFQEDFTPEILKRTRIEFVNGNGFKEDFPIDRVHVLVVTANRKNVEHLIEWSYIRPFARVVCDDYTSLSDLPYMRQILTYSFIPVSGSGFERTRDIPPSYFSLKNIPTSKITMVGNPKETYEGVMRDNILTAELMGCASNLDIYQFVSKIENSTRRAKAFTNLSPTDLFKELAEFPKLENYIKYGFFIENLELLRMKIPMLKQDLDSGKVNPSRVPNFLRWYQTSPDKTFKEYLVNPSGIQTNVGLTQLVDGECLICHDIKEKHLGFGVLTGCCGCFICSKCIGACATHVIRSSSRKDADGNIVPDEEIRDDENYYCVCCREKNPKYYFNTTQQSPDSNLYSYLLAKKYFDVHELENSFPVDYYFKMILDGFSMNQDECKGRAINIANDIENGLIPADIFRKGIIPEITKVKAIDILGGQVVNAIYNTYVALNIRPANGSKILIYMCPNLIIPRLISTFEELKRQPNSPFEYVDLNFYDKLSSVIGASWNINSLILWNSDMDQADTNQTLGRLMRINTFNNPIVFYVSLNKSAYE